LRRDELATLAEIGALNAFGHDRRSALWQVERAARRPGELFEEAVNVPDDFGSSQHSSVRLGPHPQALRLDSLRSLAAAAGAADSTHVVDSGTARHSQPAPNAERRAPNAERRDDSPLRPMTASERLMADYAGTSLTIGPHPLALRRAELALRGVLRAIDLPRGRHGRRVRVAGAVITRQRPGTAKGFVFLTLEDETGIANIIIRPDLFTEQRNTIVGAPYLLVEGTLQIQEGVTSIKAERVFALAGGGPDPESHDFR
jgi:error-prone DNA polymerase